MSVGIRNVAVIGGGWAGCAAAVELVQRGHLVTLLEASRTLGGRARSVDTEQCVLDNGQHILLGAYTESLRLMRVVGVDPSRAFLRLPLQMRYPRQSEAMDFLTPSLPAPLHVLIGLLRAQGLNRSDKMSLARFFTTVRWMGWSLNQDCSVTELLERFDQTDRLTKLMWSPLCIAALNTPPDRASAQIFLNVLRDSVGARRRDASDMLIPRVNLSELFPEKAASFLHQRGSRVLCGTSVKKLWDDDGRWWMEASGAGAPSIHAASFDTVILATQPSQAAGLLGELIDTGPLLALTYEPITTCYLQYTSDIHLSQPFFALVDTSDGNGWGQFVFDRGVISEEHAGLLAVVISASGEAIESGHQALTESIAAQLAQTFDQPALRHPLWTKIISEKRATFSCGPSLERPGNATGRRGLLLAGDYTASDYPATLESAVRSGIQAARDVA